MGAPWENYKSGEPSAGPDSKEKSVDRGPWSKYQADTPASQPASQNSTSVPQTALEGFGNGASMGYLPQLQALASKPIYQALNQANLRFGDNEIQPDDYVAERDANIARQAQQAKSNPYTAGAANVAGAVTSSLAMTPLLPASAATIGGRVAQAGKIGAAMGFAGNPGDTQGQVDTSGQIPQRVMNAGKGMTLAMLLGTALETPGIVKAGANAAKNTIAEKLGANAEYTPVENKDAIEAAAKKLGVNDVPKAVLTDNPTFQKLESGLSQSGSLPAKGIREQYNNFFKALDKASEKISSLKTGDSDFAIGKGIQGDLAEQVNASREPVGRMYEELAPHLKNIEVNPDVSKKAFAALKRDNLFKTSDGQAMIAEYQNAVKDVPDLASLKEFRSTLRDSVGPNASPLEAKRMEAIANTVSSIRDNSINALKQHVPAEMHGEVDGLIDDLALADAAHAQNIKDVNSVKGVVGNKDFKSPSTFVSKLAGAKEADVAERAANLDVSSLQAMKEKFPSVFEKAKAAKINDLIQSSTNPVTGFNDSAFLKRYAGLDQELKNLLFTPEMQGHIEALQTVKQAIPEKLGPSGTPGGQMMMDMLNPKRNALDFGIKKALDSATATPEASVASQSQKPPTTGNVLKLISSQPSQKAGVPAISNVPKAADNKPTKGPDKWASDGLNNLKEHAQSSDEKAQLEKLKSSNDQSTKELLIRASDLKPGSKAMDKIMEKIKARMTSKVAGGDE